MADKVRLSHTAMKVLKCFVDQPRVDLCGSDIAKTTNMPSGCLYPILRRLEDAGWLIDHWEVATPKGIGRPRRRYYRLTPLGQRLASEAFNDLGLGIRLTPQ